MQFFFTRYATVKERSTLAASDEWSGGKEKLYQPGSEMSRVGWAISEQERGSGRNRPLIVR